jgi:hypothetical protein
MQVSARLKYSHKDARPETKYIQAELANVYWLAHMAERHMEVSTDYAF